MMELSPEARKLIETARSGDDPNDAERARVRTSLAGVVGAGSFGAAMATTHGAAAAAKGAAAGASTAAGKLALWFGASSLITAGALFGGSVLLNSATQARQERSARVAQPTPQPAPTAQRTAETKGSEAPTTAPRPPSASPARPAAQSIGSPRPQPTAAPREAMRVEATPAAPSVGSFPNAKAVPAPPRAHSLSEETALLRAAQARLNAGDPLAALQELRQHEQRYPSGSLVPERLTAMVHALCAAGRTSEATRFAKQLEATFPTSPLLQRVRTSCISAAEFSATEPNEAGN